MYSTDDDSLVILWHIEIYVIGTTKAYFITWDKKVSNVDSVYEYIVDIHELTWYESDYMIRHN